MSKKRIAKKEHKVTEEVLYCLDLHPRSDATNKGQTCIPTDLAEKIVRTNEQLVTDLLAGRKIPPLPVEQVSAVGNLIAARLKDISKWDCLRMIIPVAYSFKPIAEIAVAQAERLSQPAMKEVGTLIDRDGAVVPASEIIKHCL